jgi:hypothetical protein
MSVDRTLSDRMELGREAAPWVIDEVRRLEDRVARWVSVEERRPEVGKIVVCHCLEDYDQTAYFVEEVDWGDEGMSYIFKNVFGDFISVESWLELPE